jgi:dihydrofolate synthase/folylpolyglutamate synthase
MLQEWLIQNYGREQMRPGPGRMHEALKDLLPQLRQIRTVTIACTNGKGETTLRLSAHLQDKRHCVWTSPHIERLTERFRSEEGEIAQEELEGLIKECHEGLKNGPHLSYYEFLFLVFCTWAIRRSPEFLLLEVGLGGRLDAVNVLDAELVLLPSISRDHQEFLGNRYELILKEKLGVLRRGATLMTGFDLRYLRERALAETIKIGSKHIDLEGLFPLPASEFSLRNQLLAFAANKYLRGEEIDLSKWNGERNFLEHRGEILKKGAEWQFFGSHNIDGLRKLIQLSYTETYTLNRQSYDSVIVTFSRRAPEDMKVMMKMLRKSGWKNIKVTTFDHPKAVPADMMEALALQEGLEFVKDIDSYVQGTSSGRILVTGSYYFLGHVRSLLRR